MAKNASTAVANPGTPALHAEDRESIAEANRDHQRTTEGTDRLDTPNIEVAEADSKILEVQRDIWHNKGSRTPVEVDFKKLTWGNNVRSTRSLQLERMISSLKTRGYDPKYPIVVSQKGKDEFLVLCGNRRTEALKRIATEEPEVFKAVLQGGKIPALVLKGLEEREEALIRIDHSDDQDRVPLDDEGMFLAVKQLVRHGYSSQGDIARQLGLFVEDRTTKTMKPNRSLIQQRVNLARLPKYVQDEFLKLMRKEPTEVLWSQVAQLFKAYEPARKKGYVDGDDAFKKLWKSFLNPSGDGDGSGGSTGSKMMTKKQIEELSRTLGSWAGQKFLLIVAGNPVEDPDTKKPMDLSDIDAVLVTAEQARADLEDIREEMGAEKFDALMAKVSRKRQAAAKAAQDGGGGEAAE